MIKDFVEIGELVNLSKHRMIGRVFDKIYCPTDIEPLRIVINVDFDMSKNIYYKNSKSICLPEHITVTYDKIKSMKSISIYNNGMILLDIPNLLQRKDIKKDNIVKIVDNYMFEKLIEYPEEGLIYRQIYIKPMLNNEFVLSGLEQMYGHRRIVNCKCEYTNMWIYIDCLQLVSRMNIFKKLWKKIREFIHKKLIL